MMTEAAKPAAADIPADASAVSKTEAHAVDPFTGEAVSVNLGATPHPDDATPIEGDRGDVWPPEPLSNDATERPRDPKTGQFVAKEDDTEPVVESDEADDVTQEASGEEPSGEEPSGEVTQEERSKSIPRERFDEVNAKRKAAEKRAQELEAQLTAKKEAAENAYDFTAAEREYGEFLLDGEFDKAVAKRAEINEALKASWTAEAAELAVQRVDYQSTKQTVESVIDKAVERFAEFDPDSPAFNDDISVEVDTMMTAYMNRKTDPMSPVKALEKALDNVVRLYGLVDRTAPKPTADPTPKPKRGAPRMDVEGKLAAARQQPPNTAAAGAVPETGEERYDLAQMSDAELEALPPATYARLRGDVL